MERKQVTDWAEGLTELADAIKEKGTADGDAYIIHGVADAMKMAADPPSRLTAMGWAHRLLGAANHIDATMPSVAEFLRDMAATIQKHAAPLRSTGEYEVGIVPEEVDPNADTKPFMRLKNLLDTRRRGK